MDLLSLLGLGGGGAAAPAGDSALIFGDPAASRRLALSRALMTAGGAMLAGGPSGTPQGFGSALGRGLMGFSQGLGAGLDEAQQGELLGLKRAEYQTEAEDRKARREQQQRQQEAIDAAAANPPAGADPAMWRTYLQANPDAALGAGIRTMLAPAEPPKSRTVRRGGAEITEEWDAGAKSWRQVGSGPAFAPQQPRDQWVDVRDAAGNVIGQRNVANGKFDQGRDPFIIVQQWNPNANAMETVAIPRAQVGAGGVGPQGGPAAAAGGGPGGAASGSGGPDLEQLAAADGAVYRGQDGKLQYEDGTPFDPAHLRKPPAAGSSSAGAAPGNVLGQGKPAGSAPMSADTAAKKALVVEGRKAAQDLRQAFDVDSPFTRFAANNPKLAFNSQEGRRLQQLARVAIGNRLRITSGAAVTDAEIDAEMEKYFPSTLDSPETARQKLDALAAYYEDIDRYMPAGGAAAGAAPTPDWSYDPATRRWQRLK